jgi:hypothetical protein
MSCFIIPDDFEKAIMVLDFSTNKGRKNVKDMAKA